ACFVFAFPACSVEFCVPNVQFTGDDHVITGCGKFTESGRHFIHETVFIDLFLGINLTGVDVGGDDRDFFSTGRRNVSFSPASGSVEIFVSNTDANVVHREFGDDRYTGAAFIGGLGVNHVPVIGEVFLHDGIGSADLLQGDDVCSAVFEPGAHSSAEGSTDSIDVDSRNTQHGT